MKIIIAGGRNIFPTIQEIDQIILASGWELTNLVHGGAKGVDLAAKAWATSKGIPDEAFLPKYQHGNSWEAPLLRNGEMAKAGDALIAIWDGESRGTKNMIEQMRGQGKPIYIHKINVP